jgi:2-keto-4-pentenoate hydratase/2-oxohepta-3-ene-1,7-dioic acid hydratase in catechol pathway
MIILRCLYERTIWFGILLDRMVHVLDGDLYLIPLAGRPLAPLEEVELLAPVVPSKIVAVGRNYAAHAAEFDNLPPEEPLLFFKPPSAVIGPNQPIIVPALSQRVDYEAELAVIVGRRCRKVEQEEAMSYILGYSCANDVTARDLQRRDHQWTRGKGFDTFCPLGPWLVTDLDPRGQEIVGRVNGEVRQRGYVRDLIFSIPYLLAYVSAVMTLEPGDVLLTGTPSGVGPLQSGDVVEVEVSGVGALCNPVIAEV